MPKIEPKPAAKGLAGMFKSAKPNVTAPSKTLVPAKKAPIPAAKSTPTKAAVSTRPAVAPLKTSLPRPVLRAFECLVNVEHAQKSIQGVGIFVGPDAEKQRALVEQITQDLIQLNLSYKTYWKQVAISTGDQE